tara:strand:- start:1859 stop:2032 length:174 start_codon:yes stop_codon:yes gene_type:complete
MSARIGEFFEIELRPKNYFFARAWSKELMLEWGPNQLLSKSDKVELASLLKNNKNME